MPYAEWKTCSATGEGSRGLVRPREDRPQAGERLRVRRRRFRDGLQRLQCLVALMQFDIGHRETDLRLVGIRRAFGNARFDGRKRVLITPEAPEIFAQLEARVARLRSAG